MSNIFNEYPYRNFSDLNLDYILRKMTEMDSRLAEYVKQSTISFHDPITWDITDQYTVNTMVVDSDGTAYLSVQPVPAGIDITNTEYWQPIFNYDDNINVLRGTIALNERDSTTASKALKAGDLVYLKGELYKIIVDMAIGTAYIIGSNCIKYTVSDRIADLLNTINDDTSSLNQKINSEVSRLDSKIDSEVSALDSKIDSEVRALDSKIGSEVSALDSKIAKTNTDLQNLSDKVATIDERDEKFIIIMDSYGTNYANPDGDSRTVFDFIRPIMGMDSDHLIGLAYGGAGFLKSYNGNFLNHFTEFTLTKDVAWRNTVKKIVVPAGRNDFEFSESEIVIAISNFINFCKTYYVNAEVSLMFIANGVNNNNGTKEQQFTVYKAFSRCGEYDALFLNGGEAVLRHSEFMADDTIHPTVLGKQALAVYIAQAIKSGSCHVNYSSQTIAIDNSYKFTYFNDTVYPLDTWISDGNCYIAPPQISSITTTTPLGIDTGTDLTVGGFVAHRNFYNVFPDIYLPVSLDIYNGDSRVNASGSLRITNENLLKIRLYAQPSVSFTKIIINRTGVACIPAIYC